MDTFRKTVKAAMSGGTAAPGGVSDTKIMGAAVETAVQMKACLKAKNPKVVQSVPDMVPLYLSGGRGGGCAGRHRLCAVLSGDRELLRRHPGSGICHPICERIIVNKRLCYAGKTRTLQQKMKRTHFS